MSEHPLLSSSTPSKDLLMLTEERRFQPAMMSLNLAVLAISGAGAADLLQGQLTCDVRSLTDGSVAYGSHCNVKGRVINYFTLYQHQGIFYLISPKALLTIQLSILKKYSVFFDVHFQVMDSQWAGFSVTGNTLPSEALALLSELPAVGNATHHPHTLLSLSGPCPMFMMWGAVDTIQALWQSLQTYIPASDFAHWQLLELLAGRPFLSAASSEVYTPHELNFQKTGAISFDKGCYIGQEIVNRMQHRGRAKQRLYAFTLDAPYTDTLPTSTLHQQDKKVGTVISATPAGVNCTQLLAVVKNQAIKNGSIHVSMDQGHELQPAPLPYSLDD